MSLSKRSQAAKAAERLTPALWHPWNTGYGDSKKPGAGLREGDINGLGGSETILYDTVTVNSYYYTFVKTHTKSESSCKLWLSVHNCQHQLIS